MQLLKPVGRSLVFVAALGCGAGVFAADDPARRTDPNSGRATFSVDVRMVVLQATVVNRRGSFVNGLRSGNFQVLENDHKQSLGLFRHSDSPVAIGLIVDNSGSMRRKHAAVLAAAKMFARNSNPKDELFVVNFNDQPHLGLAHGQMYSANSRQLEKALPISHGGGKTALYDALELGLGHIRQLTQEKKALILISDGGDNASTHTVNQVIADATNADVMIFSIGLFGKDVDETDPAFMKQIAHVTGGEAFLPARPSQAAKSCKRIAQTIRNVYTLGYSPNSLEASDKFRAIQVNVHARKRGVLLARTRAGYTPQLNVAGAEPVSSTAGSAR